MKLLSLIVLVATAFALGVSGDEMFALCGAPVNLLFIVDKSKSVTNKDFLHEKEFLRDMIGRLDIGPSKVRMAVVLKSSKTFPMFDFNEHKTRAGLLKAVNGMACKGCNKKDSKGYAFKHALYLLTPKHGAREGAKNIVIVLTDGQKVGRRFLKNVNKFKKRGTVMAVGVGNRVNVKHLMDMASGKHLFRVGAFNQLPTITMRISNDICGLFPARPHILPPHPLPPHPLPPLPIGLRKCDVPLDLLLLLDKSASLSNKQFKLTQEFVKNMLGEFNIHPDRVRVSVVLFAIKHHNMFCFTKHTTLHDLQKAVMNLKCPKCRNGKTGTGDALQYGREHSFTAKCGSRPNAKKIVVIFTDGKSTEKQDYLKNQAMMMKKVAHEVLAVGIGSAKKIDRKELELLATDNEFVFMIHDFSLLGAQLGPISTKTCAASAKCDQPIDLLLLLDKSASVRRKQFKLAQKFVRNMIGKFNIHPDKVRVSVVIFAIKHHNMFCFNTHTSREAVQKAVMNLKCPKCRRGKTGTGDALQYGREHSFTAKCGSRPGVKKVVVILTDGKSTENQQYLKRQAHAMKKTADEIISVGIGKKGKIDRKELELLATKNKFVFMVNDYVKLGAELDAITSKTCEAGIVDKNDCKPSPCMHGGVCTDLVNDFSCKCPAGFSGKDCGIDINDCKPSPCLNGGVCTDLVNDYKCKCHPGWAGKKCSINIDECKAGPCKNGGVCTDLVNDFSCKCPAGRHGKDCSGNTDDCKPSPCLNGGVCSDLVNDYKCKCHPGWAGKKCEINIDECKAGPCKNGGICTDMINGFSCECESGFSGKDCSTIDCPPTPTLTLSSHEVLKGSEVKVLCTTTNFGAPLTYIFFRNGVKVHEGPNHVLLIPKAEAAHIGGYTCEASRAGIKCEQSPKKMLAVMDKCNVPIDLLLLLDKSASVSKGQFKVALNFVSNMMGKFDIGLDKVRVSTVLFAIYHHNMFCFTEHTTTSAVQSAILALTCPKCKPGRTGTGDALQYGREHSFTPACGARPNAKKIVFVLTDGQSTESAAYLENQSNLMKQTADEVIAVGIGSKGKINRDELELIATSPENVVMIEGFALLDAKLDEISSKTCMAGTA